MSALFLSHTVLILAFGVILRQFFPIPGNKKPDQFFTQHKWTIWHAILILLLDAYSIIFLKKILINGLDHLISPFWTRFLVPIWTAGILFIFFRLLKDSIQSAGLRLTHIGAGVFFGVKNFFGFLAIMSVLFTLSSNFGNHFQETGTMWKEQVTTQGIFWPYFFVLINCVFLSLYAFQEEIIYRGIFYGAIRQHLPPTPSILLNAFFFTIFHMEFSIIVFFLGILLATMYERSRTLLSVAVFHVLWNSFLMINQTIGIPFDLDPFYYYFGISIGSLAVFLFLMANSQTSEKAPKVG
jgi:membrane protease YdiL (CAAX protease family)